MQELRIEYKDIDWCFQHIYDKNDKLHDIGAIVLSIQKHGFRNPPIYDATLKGIIAGNGRIEALYQMWRTSYDLPEGIKLEGTMWQIPIIFGVDAKNVAQAVAYLLDDNNLTVMGGDFTAVDTMRMWGENYIELLLEAYGETVSIDLDDVKLMRQLADMTEEPLELGGARSESQQLDEDMFFLRVVFEDEGIRDTTKELLTTLAGTEGISPAAYLYNLLSQQ